MNQIYGGGVFREAADVDGEEAHKENGDESRKGHRGLVAEEAVWDPKVLALWDCPTNHGIAQASRVRAATASLITKEEEMMESSAIALAWLMSVPGASNTVLESVPTQFASRQTAEEMALLAYNRALKLSKPGSPVLGVGFTGSLATTHPKLGDHRFHVSTRTSDHLWVSTVTLTKGLRNREQEDRVSSHVLLKAIANACEVPTTFVSELTESEVPDECVKHFDEDQELEQLISGEICFKVYPFSSETHTSDTERKIILSGSFNPLHEGHLKLLEVATRPSANASLRVVPNASKDRCDTPFTKSHDFVKESFLSCLRLVKVGSPLRGQGGEPCNFDDPSNLTTSPQVLGDPIQGRGSLEHPMTYVTWTQVRVSGVSAYVGLEHFKTKRLFGKTVIISNQPFFYKKAELFPGSAFVIGADTAARLFNPKYYGGDYGKMVEILVGCKRTGTIFLVGGRNVDGVFKVLEDFDIPEVLKDMFISIPSDRFRMDISSTEIRKSLGM
ncbi:hypothetical protein TEA_024405 [Camellia sinensis var. sinensis]|uniref:Uncharacterized protein n=1 Tax=Camellia sinensis var. sinensis TaxID=542762 RepID=A0A4S4D1G5_CAMSN|nr:hypothetical protein TEA_024405 [Camellia sinensis var. sinensis]